MLVSFFGIHLFFFERPFHELTRNQCLGCFFAHFRIPKLKLAEYQVCYHIKALLMVINQVPKKFKQLSQSQVK